MQWWTKDHITYMRQSSSLNPHVPILLGFVITNAKWWFFYPVSIMVTDKTGTENSYQKDFVLECTINVGMVYWWMRGINNINNGFKIVIPVQYWYLVGMSKWGSFVTWVIIQVNPILNHNCMKALAWYIELHAIENKNAIKYPYPVGIKKM